ncbi:nucleotide sugar dehydrogenase [Candidatus Bathyarchaeota archaeon]|nr:nucleotide sugar dehydrogenase [Candidatus Bathyarchaeota archaeon]
MPAVLRLKPEEIDTIEKRGKYTVSVIGCGQKGVLYATAFAEAGFRVICTDADQSLVKRLAKGKTPFSEREMESKLKSFMRTGQLSATSELKSAVSQSDIIIMTLSMKIDDKKSPDYSEVESSCKQVGAALSRGALFIYGGIAGFGFTEGVIKETLENTSGLRVGEDFGLVYTPIQISDGQPVTSIANQELKVAAIDGTSLDAASTVLGVITKKGVKQIPDVKTAELAVLFTVAKQDANIALANELAMFCESAGLDYFEVLKLLDMRETSFFPTIAEEDNRSEAYLLLENAENLNTKLRLSALARQINEDMARHAVNLTQDTLRSCGKTLRRARVAVLGTAKPRTATDTFVRMLETKGAKTSLYDPLFSKNELLDATRALKRSLNEAVEGTDCIVILTGQDQFKRLNLKKLQALMKKPAAIVDLVGIIEPQKVEKEGFTYRGLGRGAGKK